MQPHPLFIYGSLLDKDILSCVLGRKIDPDMVCPARLADFATHTYPNESFPLLKSSPGHFATGEVIYGLTETDFDRINFYEGDEYGFGELQAELTDGSLITAIYNRSEPIEANTPEWNLTCWQRDEKPLFMGMCQRYMALYGTMTIDEADVIWQQLVKENQAQKSLPTDNTLIDSHTPGDRLEESF